MEAFGGDDKMKQLCMFLAELASFWEDGKDNYSFLVRMEDSRDLYMEYLYGFLVGIANSGTDNMKKLLVGIADSWKNEQRVNEESMNSLLIAMADLGYDKKEKLHSLLEGMVKNWGDDKEKIHRWVMGKLDSEKKLKLYTSLDMMTDLSEVEVEMADSRENSMEKLYSLQDWLLNSLKDNKQTVNNSWIDEEKMYLSLVDFCEYNKKKLSTPYVLLDRIIEFCKVEVGMADSREDSRQKLYNLMVILEESCKDNQETFATLCNVVDDLEEKNTKEMCSLLADFCEEDKEKLYQSLIETGDFLENEKKLKLYILLDKMADICKTDHVEMATSGEDYMEESHNQLLYRLVSSWEGNKETMNYESLYSFLNDLGEHEDKLYKEKLYSLLEDLCKTHKEKLEGDLFENEKKRELYILLDGMMDFCEYRMENLYDFLVDKETLYRSPIKVWEESLYRKCFLAKITDLWEGQPNKEKLHSLLVEASDFVSVVRHGDYNNNKLNSLLVEMTGLWKGSLINKVESCSWVAKEADHLGHNRLFHLLLRQQ